MSYLLIPLAALGATVAYFAAGGLLFGLLPVLRDEFRRYPAVYRTQDGIKAVILALAVIYPMTYRNGDGCRYDPHTVDPLMKCVRSER